MNSKFENLVEEQLSTITTTKTTRFPRQIKFSEEFMEAIEKEFYTQILSESPESPVRNRPQKFIKALEFVVADLVKNEETNKPKYMLDEGTDEYKACSENTPKYEKGEASDKTRKKNVKDRLEMNAE